MPDLDIDLPYNWDPRRYQMPLWQYLQDGGKRAVVVWHRRSGKDDLALRWASVSAMQRPATYWHMLPEASQARKAIWEAVNPHTGKRRIDEAFPPALIEARRENEMFVRFRTGATWQAVGSDNFDSLVGSPPAGVVFSEYALADPRAWAMLRPILAENGGWALFISTPRGRNHFHSLFTGSQDDPLWFTQKLTAEQTGVFSAEGLTQEKREYVREYGPDEGEALFRQEYLCDFTSPLLGAYFARQMDEAEAENRLTRVPYDPGKPCVTGWDLGIGDSTVIWIAQQVGLELRILDCIAGSGVGLDWYAEQLHKRPYKYREHLLPHDAAARELGTGRSREETLRSLEVTPSRILPAQSVDDGINAVRRLLPSMLFDREKCARGIEAMRQYRRNWDDKNKMFQPRPLHDWSSHYCFTGDTQVLTRYGTCRIMNLPNEGEVLTPCGWKRYLEPRITRRSAPVVAVTFSDGSTVKCTPDHMFLTGSGWTSASDLVRGSRILSTLTRSRSISMAAFTAYGRVRSTCLAAAGSCIGTFGSLLLALSPMGAMSTIGMPTRGTTSSATWSAFLPRSISTLPLPRDAKPKTVSTSARAPGNWPTSGINPRKAGSGIADKLSVSRAGQNGSGWPSRAYRAARSSWLWCVKAATARNTAPSLARPLTIASVGPLPELHDVWCLTVPDGQSFSLANGAVVHNCDALRTLAMGLRRLEPANDTMPRETRGRLRGDVSGSSRPLSWVV